MLVLPPSFCTRGGFPHPLFSIVDDIVSFGADGAQVELAPGLESCHHVSDEDVEFFLIVGLHVEVASLLDSLSRKRF